MSGLQQQREALGLNVYPETAYSFIYSATEYPILAKEVGDRNLQIPYSFLAEQAKNPEKLTLVVGLGGEVVRAAFVRGNTEFFGRRAPSTEQICSHVQGHSVFSRELEKFDNVTELLVSSSLSAYRHGLIHTERLF